MTVCPRGIIVRGAFHTQLAHVVVNLILENNKVKMDQLRLGKALTVAPTRIEAEVLTEKPNFGPHVFRFDHKKKLISSKHTMQPFLEAYCGLFAINFV